MSESGELEHKCYCKKRGKGNILIFHEHMYKCCHATACCGIFGCFLALTVTIIIVYFIHIAPIVYQVRVIVQNSNNFIEVDLKEISNKAQGTMESGKGLLDNDAKQITEKLKKMLDSGQSLLDEDARNITSKVQKLLNTSQVFLEDTHDIVLEKNGTLTEILINVNDTLLSANTTFRDILDTTQQIRDTVNRWSFLGPTTNPTPTPAPAPTPTPAPAPNPTSSQLPPLPI